MLSSHRPYVVAAPRDQVILAFMNYGMYKLNLFLPSQTQECCVYGLTLPFHMLPFIPSKVQISGGRHLAHRHPFKSLNVERSRSFQRGTERK